MTGTLSVAVNAPGTRATRRRGCPYRVTHNTSKRGYWG
nr:MAG TPA: hypothetical protein [Caudoviricetes sp.]